MHPWRTLTRAVALFLLAAILPALPAGAGEPDPGPELGTNLTRLLSNKGEWPFVDAFKTSVGWLPGENHGCFACPDAGTLTLDTIIAAPSLYADSDLVFYEGGQHLADWTGPDTPNDRTLLFVQANRDNRMGAMYDQLFVDWQQVGDGNLLLHYVNVETPRPWGSFGALEYQDQPDHSQSDSYVGMPKYQALMRLIDSYGGD